MPSDGDAGMGATLAMRVLIVEDDMVIAGTLGPVVTRAGHELVGLAADQVSAVALLQATKVDLAFVDVHLLDGWTGVEVVRAANAEGAAAIFTTANRGMVPANFAGACGLIDKPYTDVQIEATLAYMAERLNGAPAEPAPKGFTPSLFWPERPRPRPTLAGHPLRRGHPSL